MCCGVFKKLFKLVLGGGGVCFVSVFVIIFGLKSLGFFLLFRIEG